MQVNISKNNLRPKNCKQRPAMCQNTPNIMLCPTQRDGRSDHNKKLTNNSRKQWVSPSNGDKKYYELLKQLIRSLHKAQRW